MNPRIPSTDQDKRDVARILENAGHDANQEANNAGNTLREKASDVRDNASNVVENVKAKAENIVGDAKDKAAEVGSQAADKVDAAMTNAGQQINRLASTVRENAPEGKIGEVAYSAANALEQSGRYLQEADVNAVRGDLESLIRRHPVESLLVGIGLGFVLARGFRR
jgi:ElaB/YqjD/DUF883 family membrane-anchored ribosome-binding protein